MRGNLKYALFIWVSRYIPINIMMIFLTFFLISSLKLLMTGKFTKKSILKDFGSKVLILILSNLILVMTINFFDYSLMIGIGVFFGANYFLMFLYRKYYQSKLLKRGLKVEKSYSS